jgi:DNA-binding transcriptional ArsR family regulator
MLPDRSAIELIRSIRSRFYEHTPCATQLAFAAPGGQFAGSNLFERAGGLAQRTRLTVFRMLVAQEPHGLAAGSIAFEIGAPQNTVSAHLGVLARAGLVIATRQHRNILYRANLARMQILIDYLISSCCEGEHTCAVYDASAACDGRQAK